MVLGKPEKGCLVLTQVKAEDGYRAVTTLDGQALTASQQADGLHVTLPEAFLGKALPLVIKLVK